MFEAERNFAQATPFLSILNGRVIRHPAIRKDSGAILRLSEIAFVSITLPAASQSRITASCEEQGNRVKYWEIIADHLGKTGWMWARPTSFTP
jgi:hypothetical protein